MARPVGRPARPTTIDPNLLAAAHEALLAIAKDLHLPVDRYPDPTTGRPRRRVRPLALAKLAIEAQEALEVLAAQEVAAARAYTRGAARGSGRRGVRDQHPISPSPFRTQVASGRTTVATAPLASTIRVRRRTPRWRTAVRVQPCRGRRPRQRADHVGFVDLVAATALDLDRYR